MASRLLRFILFGLFFLCAAVILWPAASLGLWLEQASDGRWRLASAAGSIWDGRGVLLARTGGAASWHSAQSIRWRLEADHWWRGRIGAVLELERGAARFLFERDALTIEQVDAALPAPLLSVMLPRALAGYGWTGMVQAHGGGFRCTWDGASCAGQIEFQWHDAGLAEIPGTRLGDYRIRLTGEGETLRADIATLGGRLEVQGTGEIRRGTVRFMGEAGANGPDGAWLNDVLRTIGRPGAKPGRVTIDYRGGMP